ncbi:hypothetical protein C8R44DRAFT_986709 [Mycena epipterygia]|nr:hypothetical protein C8R44DRAFT_986709 [Mycena epipterygia]
MSIANRKLDLPVELEREIFEIAAKADVGTALRLALVARRVQAWIEPIIYSRVVVAHAPEAAAVTRVPRITLARQISRAQKPRKAPKVHVPRFIRTIPFRPASFFERHVKRLDLGNLTEPELVTVLTTCTGILELGWWGSTLTAPVALAFGALSLHRLSVDHSFNFHFPGINVAPMFATITHLDITWIDHILPPRLPPLEKFTALTHFSATHRLNPDNRWCDDVLEACPRLSVLLVFSDQMYYEQISGFRPRHADPRVVVMLPPVRDWTARWVHDAWPLAEGVVRERRNLAIAEKLEKAASALDS